jgi:hypothetical protein
VPILLQARRFAALTLTGLALLASPAAAHAAIVANGSFETADLSGWQTQDTFGGDWVVFSSGSVIAFTIAAPVLGTHAAVTARQGFPSRQLLYQDVTLPSERFRVQLGLFAFHNAERPLVSPDTLDLSGTNEQYRIDVIRPTAPLDSVAPADVLATVFRTRTGSPTFLGNTRQTADLSRYAGQTVRLRFAVVVTEGVLHGGVDVISVTGLDLSKAKLNRRKGSARLRVTVTDPGRLSVSGRGVRRNTVRVTRMAELPVEPTPATARGLSGLGTANVKAKIVYTPDGAVPQSEVARIRLEKS